ncbi:MAG: DUF2264 domain-containing protein [Opitutales bacterium]|nr:DUF2264 domain-containing protein [Opitutales bacterium]MCH8541727.1 DUF2264 domain-containing protein [Opitutales bacterium]
MKRSDWITYAERLARPVLEAAAKGQLSENLAAQCHAEVDPGQKETAPLEAMGRLLAGLGPWFRARDLDPSEAALRDELAGLARTALDFQSDPDHPAYLHFRGEETQTLVDAAFLAHGLLRGKSALWDPLPNPTKTRLHQAMLDLRNRKPHFNNWLLFGAMTESFLLATGGPGDRMRIDYALRQHEQWYVGDGTYGDGPAYHADYYNAYVIHPMLTDILREVGSYDPDWQEFWDQRQRIRLRRAAAIQERMIAPDGSFPVLGRSLCYRCGAFQTLAQAALLDLLPPELPPAQVRSALSAVIKRTLSPTASWRNDNFLQIGLSGHQPSLGESYITTGSLYLAACAFLPLGLSPSSAFWSGPDQPWTSIRAWDLSADIPADHALANGR